ncbi:MAG: tetratricopeptide repeat protein, partial [Cyanobacteria bacterium J06648_11]
PDPRINLALTLEKAGQADDAAASYRAALEMAPLSVDAMTGLARLQIRTTDTSGETVELLRKIEKSTDDASLRSWARDQRLRLMPFGSIGR